MESGIPRMLTGKCARVRPPTGLRMLVLVPSLFLDGLQRRGARIPFVGSQRIRPVCRWLVPLRLVSCPRILCPPYCIHGRANGTHWRDVHVRLEGPLSSSPLGERRSIVPGRHDCNSSVKRGQVCRLCSRRSWYKSVAKVARSREAEIRPWR